MQGSWLSALDQIQSVLPARWHSGADVAQCRVGIGQDYLRLRKFFASRF